MSDELLEKIERLRNLMREFVTPTQPIKPDYAQRCENSYLQLREPLMGMDDIYLLLPRFVKTHDTLSAFAQTMKTRYKTYAERRLFIQDEFEPLIQMLETTTGFNEHVLQNFDQTNVSINSSIQLASQSYQSDKHVFISYSRADKLYAEALYVDLQKRSIPIWKDNQIEVSDIWWDEIEKAIRNSFAFIVIMSPKSKQSAWVKKEIHLAQDLELPIFPLLLKGDRFPLLGDIQFENVTNGLLPTEKFYTKLNTKL